VIQRTTNFWSWVVNGHADVLITGDSDLLALSPFRGNPIITPADFVQDDAR